MIVACPPSDYRNHPPTIMHLSIREGFLRTSYNIVKWSSSKGGTVKLMFVAVLASYLQTVSNGQLLTQQSLYHLVNPNPSSIRMSSYSNTVPDLLKSCLCVAPHHSLTKLRVV